MKVVAGQGSECWKDHAVSRARICLINRIQDGAVGRNTLTKESKRFGKVFIHDCKVGQECWS